MSTGTGSVLLPQTETNNEKKLMKNRITRLLAICGIMLLVACSAENEYSNISCYFIFDNSTHQDFTLQSAMNSVSPGIFCRISETVRSGKTSFKFESNQGGEPTYKDANAVDMRRSRALGLYNAVIVGFGNLSTPAVFYAYDNQCPNCYNSTGLMRYAMTMNSNGTVSCKSCGRTYDLNNGGVITKGESGSHLIRYRASTTGPLGILSVTN